ncbi:MAG: extracellular solute-binding protein [Armatimonadota bacterium]
MKKIITKSIYSLLPIILLFSICNIAIAKEEKVKLVVWGLRPSEEAVGQRAQIEEFERRNPNVKVTVLNMGAGQMNPQKLMTAIVGKTPPDVINQDRFTIGDWASRDTFMDLGPLIEKDKGSKNAIDPKDYYVPCWEEAQYKGKVYAIPNSTDARILYYNKTLFKEAGLDPNKPPKTWEELLEYSKKLTKINSRGEITQIGFIPQYGNSWLYLYSWQNGGNFLSDDGKTCTLDNQYTIDTLKFMVKIYDELGGARNINRFSSGFRGDQFDPFLTNKVAMKIDVDLAIYNIARFNPDLNFGVAPAPVPEERVRQTAQNVDFLPNGTSLALNFDIWNKKRNISIENGRFTGEPRYITWSGGFSWAIPVGAKNVELAWEFIKWMNSPEAGLVFSKAQKEYNLSKGRPFVSLIHANMKVNDTVFAEYLPTTPKFRDAQLFALSMMPYSKFRPVTFVGQMLWDEQVRAFDLAVNYQDSKLTPEQALKNGREVVQRELDRSFSREKFPLIPVWSLGAAITLIILTLIIVLFISIKRTGKIGPLMRSEAIAGFSFASPWLIGFLIFTIGPIVASIVFSFCDYNVLSPPRWVGLNNYSALLSYDWATFSKALYNVSFLAVIGLPLGIITGLSIAMLLNTDVKGMSWYRTIYYLPSIVPVVASAVLWLWVLNPQYGIVNAAWKVTLTEWFNLNPPGWMSQPGEFFGIVAWIWNHTLGLLGLELPSIFSHPPSYLGAKSALITMGLWGAGGGMIIWLAGLKGIPTSYYEAAELDGANKFHQFRYVTLPMLSPYIFFNFIMGTIAVLQTFDNVYVMTGGSGGPVDSTLVPVLLLFNNAFRYFNMGYASALAWILFAIVLIFTLAQLKLAPRWVHYESEKGK